MAVTPGEVRNLARQYAPRMIHVLRGIAESPKAPQASRVAAAQALLDRAIGKPAQMIVGDEENGPIKLEIDDRTQRLELARRMAYLLAQADTQAIDGGRLELEDAPGNDAAHHLEDEEDSDS